jgi:hypothetical protein
MTWRGRRGSRHVLDVRGRGARAATVQPPHRACHKSSWSSESHPRVEQNAETGSGKATAPPKARPAEVPGRRSSHVTDRVGRTSPTHPPARRAALPRRGSGRPVGATAPLRPRAAVPRMSHIVLVAFRYAPTGGASAAGAARASGGSKLATSPECDRRGCSVFSTSANGRRSATGRGRVIDAGDGDQPSFEAGEMPGSLRAGRSLAPVSSTR